MYMYLHVRYDCSFTGRVFQIQYLNDLSKKYSLIQGFILTFFKIAQHHVYYNITTVVYSNVGVSFKACVLKVVENPEKQCEIGLKYPQNRLKINTIA